MCVSCSQHQDRSRSVWPLRVMELGPGRFNCRSLQPDSSGRSRSPLRQNDVAEHLADSPWASRAWSPIALLRMNDNPDTTLRMLRRSPPSAAGATASVPLTMRSKRTRSSPTTDQPGRESRDGQCSPSTAPGGHRGRSKGCGGGSSAAAQKTTAAESYRGPSVGSPAPWSVDAPSACTAPRLAKWRACATEHEGCWHVA